MSEHGEVLSPLQQSADDSNRSNVKNEEDSSDEIQRRNESDNFQNLESGTHTPFSENSNAYGGSNAYNVIPTFSSREPSADPNDAAEQDSGDKNQDEVDPSAAFPGLNQLTGLVPTVSQLTSLVPTNATDALVTVMVRQGVIRLNFHSNF